MKTRAINILIFLIFLLYSSIGNLAKSFAAVETTTVVRNPVLRRDSTGKLSNGIILQQGSDWSTSRELGVNDKAAAGDHEKVQYVRNPSRARRTLGGTSGRKKSGLVGGRGTRALRVPTLVQAITIFVAMFVLCTAGDAVALVPCN